MTIEEAQQILLASELGVTAQNQELIRQALLLVVSQSDYQILGICADTATPGILALKTYAQALGYPEPNLNLANIPGSVYIKYNPKTGLCYLDSYIGEHRGVLVSCQSASGGINQMFGHLPLDLFVSVTQ